MSQVIAQDRITHESQRFFLGTGECCGVQNVNYSYDSSFRPLNYLGAASTKYSPEGPMVGAVSVNSLLISNDIILPYTGDIGTNGYLLRSRTNTNQNVSFVSGYLTSYNSRCSIGQIPTIDARFDVFGNIGTLSPTDNDIIAQLSQIQLGSQLDLLRIPGPGSISINLNEFTTNRVQSYDLSISVPRSPYYILGQVSPKYVKINWPMEVTLNFSIDKNDYENTALRTYITNIKKDNIILSIADYDTNTTIVSYNLPNMLLSTQSITSETNKNSSINLTYKGYIQASI